MPVFVELFPREIDVMPGLPPQARQAHTQNQRALGNSAVIVLHNNTNQQNAFTLTVRGDDGKVGKGGNPNWRSGWYKLEPRPLYGDNDHGSPLFADQSGEGWVRVFVPAGQKREVDLLFDPPARPDSRAGTYPITVEATPSVSDQAGEIPQPEQVGATVYLHPYFDWEMEIDPHLPAPERHVTRRKPGAESQLVIKNRGNDYLYLDVTVVKSPQFTGKPLTTRVAIPPTDSASPHAERRLPVQLAAVERPWKGKATPLPVQVQATRVHAPSVAPPPASAWAFSPGVPGAPNPNALSTGLPQGAVLADPPFGEAPQTATGALVYHPPIASSFTDFVGTLSANAKGIAMTVAGLAVAFAALLYMLNGFFTSGVNPVNLPDEKSKFILGVKAEKEPAFLLRGPLANYKFYAVKGKRDGDKVTYEADASKLDLIPLTKVEKGLGKSRVSANALTGTADKIKQGANLNAQMAEQNAARLDLSAFKGETVRIYARRGGFLGWLSWLQQPFVVGSRDGVPVGVVKAGGETEEAVAPDLQAAPVGIDGTVTVTVINEVPLPKGGKGMSVFANAQKIPITVAGDGLSFTATVDPSTLPTEAIVNIAKYPKQTLTLKGAPLPSVVDPPTLPPSPTAAPNEGSGSETNSSSGGGTNTGGTNNRSGANTGTHSGNPVAPPNPEAVKEQILAALASGASNMDTLDTVWEQAGTVGEKTNFAQAVRAIVHARKAKAVPERAKKNLASAKTALEKAASGKPDDQETALAYIANFAIDDAEGLDTTSAQSDAEAAIAKVSDEFKRETVRAVYKALRP